MVAEGGMGAKSSVRVWSDYREDLRSLDGTGKTELHWAALGAIWISF